MVLLKVITFCMLLVNHWVGCQEIKYDNEVSYRIVGAFAARPGRYPYQVSVQKRQQHICGGAIISDQWVLTAGHCTIEESATSLTVLAGTHLLDGSGTRYNLESIREHPSYIRAGNVSRNDIALLKLNRKINFNDLIKPIALPKTDTPGERTVVLTGWGMTMYHKDIISEEASRTLKMLYLTSITNNECQRSFSIPIDSTQLCTRGYFGRGACKGDSGSPLVDESTLVGVASFVQPCGVGAPDVYTRVYSYLDWINSYISS